MLGWESSGRSFDNMEMGRESNPARLISYRDRRGDTVAAAGQTDRAPQRDTRSVGRCSIAEDAANLLTATVIRPIGPAVPRCDSEFMRPFVRVEPDAEW